MTTNQTKEEQIVPFDEHTLSDTERLYYKRVNHFFAHRVGKQFSNGSATHAVYLISQFLKRAQQEVRIFSGSLTRQTSDGVAIYSDPRLIHAAKEFLRKDGRLRVLLQSGLDGSKDEHPLVSALDEWKDKTFFLRSASDHSISFLEKEQFLHHMAIMDETAWRIETKTRRDRQGKLRSVDARVNLADPRGAKSLKKLFDVVLFQSGQSLLTTPV